MPGKQLQSALVLLVIIHLLLPATLWLFATGFFPYKPFLPGRNHAQPTEAGSTPAAPFDKLVFMVVDALRSDFVFAPDSGFHFLHGLVNSGAAVPFTAYAAPPTVTMPRIKAVTTGSLPTFLDAILNFAESDTSSSLSTQDSWPSQMLQQRHGQLVMYGDDTWLKLFPGIFSRSDGTSSFFVSDFTEVDNNVTRHVPYELTQDDWTAMVLHYLGLDHIGHKTGPRSVHMLPKQREMDNIVKRIYEAFESQPHLQSALLVLCGDHGMNDAGNHGGSTSGETSSGLVFVSPKLRASFDGSQCPAPLNDRYQYFDSVEQSDIVPTLASLLGFPIPLNNVGVLIPSFLKLWPDRRDQKHLLDANIDQIKTILSMASKPGNGDTHETDCSPVGHDTPRLGHKLKQIQMVDQASSADTQDKINARLEFLRSAQETLGRMSTEYNLRRLRLGVAGACALTILALVAHLLVSVFSGSNAFWTWVIIVCQTVSVFSSSYVEEEHQLWYWLSSGWMAWLYIACSRQGTRWQCTPVILLLCSARIQRRWNHTGQQHSDGLDIASTLLSAHPFVLVALTLFAYTGTLVGMLRYRQPSVLSKTGTGTLSLVLLLVAVLFKFKFTATDSPELLLALNLNPSNFSVRPSLTVLARIVFGGIVANLLISAALVYPSNRFQNSGQNGFLTFVLANLGLFLITQSRVSNITLFVLFWADYWVLRRMGLGLNETATTLVLLQHTSFFAFGGSNSMSSIDLSSAYNGVNDFNVLAVGVLIFLSNWTGPIWWTVASASELSRMHGKHWAVFLRLASILGTFNTASVAAVMSACIMFRSHLFVWTVFSPKFLYSIAWGLGLHLLVGIGFGSLAFWAGQSRLADAAKER